MAAWGVMVWNDPSSPPTPHFTLTSLHPLHSHPPLPLPPYPISTYHSLRSSTPSLQFLHPYPLLFLSLHSSTHSLPLHLYSISSLLHLFHPYSFPLPLLSHSFFLFLQNSTLYNTSMSPFSTPFLPLLYSPYAPPSSPPQKPPHFPITSIPSRSYPHLFTSFTLIPSPYS